MRKPDNTAEFMQQGIPTIRSNYAVVSETHVDLILAIMEIGNGATIGDLQKHLGIQTGGANKRIKHEVANGRIRRVKNDPKDRDGRIVRVYVTKKGLIAVGRLLQHVIPSDVLANLEQPGPGAIDVDE